MVNQPTAQTINQLRNQILVSLWGRKQGFDSNEYDIGAYDHRLVIDNIATTAATSLSPSGLSVLNCTAASSALYTMNVVIPGIYKQISQLSTSTLGFAVQFSSGANLVSTFGSSFNQVTFAGQGHTLNLFCASSVGTAGPLLFATGPVMTTATGFFFSTF